MQPLRRSLAIPGAILFALGIVCSEREVQAQGGGGPPVRVVPVRDLEFGDVIPGVDMTVSHADPTSGLWEIRARNNSVVRIEFAGLPTAMNGAGDSMPIDFDPNSAQVIVPRSSTPPIVFDPTGGVTIEMGRPGRAFVYLGGVAKPRDDQAPGTYASPVTLIVEYTPTGTTS